MNHQEVYIKNDQSPSRLSYDTGLIPYTGENLRENRESLSLASLPDSKLLLVFFTNRYRVKCICQMTSCVLGTRGCAQTVKSHLQHWLNLDHHLSLSQFWPAILQDPSRCFCTSQIVKLSRDMVEISVPASFKSLIVELISKR